MHSLFRLYFSLKSRAPAAVWRVARLVLYRLQSCAIERRYPPDKPPENKPVPTPGRFTATKRASSVHEAVNLLDKLS